MKTMEDNNLSVQWFCSWICNMEIWQLFQTAENNVIFSSDIQ